MQCTCKVDSFDDYGDHSFARSNIVKAKKIHQCDECYKVITPGESYEYHVGCYDGDFYTAKTCLDCLSLRDVFFTSWLFRHIWEDFEDKLQYCNYSVPESDISKLTDIARWKVCEIIESHWDEP